MILTAFKQHLKVRALIPFQVLCNYVAHFYSIACANYVAPTECFNYLFNKLHDLSNVICTGNAMKQDIKQKDFFRNNCINVKVMHFQLKVIKRNIELPWTDAPGPCRNKEHLQKSRKNIEHEIISLRDFINWDTGRGNNRGSQRQFGMQAQMN